MTSPTHTATIRDDETPSPNWPKDKIERLVSLRNNARSSGQIAQEMGITRNAVIGKLSRMNLKSLFFGRGCNSMIRILTPPRGIPSVAAIMSTVKRKPYVRGQKPVQAMGQPPKLKTRPRPVCESGKGKLITDLAAHECRFATGTNSKREHLFCGCPTDNSSWCEFHRTRVFKSSEAGRE